MCPLPIEGADASFYVRLFITSWYIGEEIAEDLERFGTTYRIPPAVLDQILEKVGESHRPLIIEPSGELGLASASAVARAEYAKWCTPPDALTLS